MAYDLEDKLVIGIASSALFDLSESDQIFREKGTAVYRQHQRDNQDNPLRPGVAFSFIRRLLGINNDFPEQHPVEVILLSRNDPDTGLRVMKSIEHHKLEISRAVFLRGNPPYIYMPAFNVSLFLSGDERSVREAIMSDYPAGQVLGQAFEELDETDELRIAFDFDGVLADDEAEQVFAETGDLKAFQTIEKAKSAEPHNPGPLKELLDKVAKIQQMEEARASEDNTYKRKVRIAILTARNAPSHERVVTSLRAWGINVDETFFLGGVEKRKVLEILKPHIFFDDQRVHLDPAKGVVPSVHVPFGIRNIEGES